MWQGNFVLGFKLQMMFSSHSLSTKVSTRAQCSARRSICCSSVLLKTFQSRSFNKKAVAVSQGTCSEQQLMGASHFCSRETSSMSIECKYSEIISTNE